jgi:hypothetical protein
MNPKHGSWEITVDENGTRKEEVGGGYREIYTAAAM